MKIREKKTGELGSSGRFNIHGMSDIVVDFDNGEMDSCFIGDFEVLLSNGLWKDLSQAFRDKDIITDNYNTRFFEPKNEEDRERGYTLY